MGNRVITGGPSTVQTNTSCNNCGYPSHCGSSAYMTIKDYACDNTNGGEYREVKVCGHCSCVNCIPKTKK